MTKKVLVVGSSSGIGLETSKFFQDNGCIVTTVSRTSDPIYSGNITDKNFREFLYSNIKPDILINCAGIYSTDVDSMLSVNAIAAIDLIKNYYNIMDPGSDIITVSSISATMSENVFLPNSTEFYGYAVSKKAVSDYSLLMCKNRQKDVRVSVIEPNDVRPTNIHRSRCQPIDPALYENYNFNVPTPMQPGYIAKIIEWLLSQPRWVTVGKIILENNFLRSNH